MPTYGYKCECCEFDFEIEQRFSDEALKVCPQCCEASLIKKIYVPIIFIKHEPTTVGHQAERNTQLLGHYEYEAKIEERKQRIKQASDKLLDESKGKNIEHSGELPWWRSGKVSGLPKEERPISIDKAQKIAKELDIDIKSPQPRIKHGH